MPISSFKSVFKIGACSEAVDEARKEKAINESLKKLDVALYAEKVTYAVIKKEVDGLVRPKKAGRPRRGESSVAANKRELLTAATLTRGLQEIQKKKTDELFEDCLKFIYMGDEANAEKEREKFRGRKKRIKKSSVDDAKDDREQDSFVFLAPPPPVDLSFKEYKPLIGRNLWDCLDMIGESNEEEGFSLFDPIQLVRWSEPGLEFPPSKIKDYLERCVIKAPLPYIPEEPDISGIQPEQLQDAVGAAGPMQPDLPIQPPGVIPGEPGILGIQPEQPQDIMGAAGPVQPEGAPEELPPIEVAVENALLGIEPLHPRYVHQFVEEAQDEEITQIFNDLLAQLRKSLLQGDPGAAPQEDLESEESWEHVQIPARRRRNKQPITLSKQHELALIMEKPDFVPEKEVEGDMLEATKKTPEDDEIFTTEVLVKPTDVLLPRGDGPDENLVRRVEEQPSRPEVGDEPPPLQLSDINQRIARDLLSSESLLGPTLRNIDGADPVLFSTTVGEPRDGQFDVENFVSALKVLEGDEISRIAVKPGLGTVEEEESAEGQPQRGAEAPLPAEAPPAPPIEAMPPPAEAPPAPPIEAIPPPEAPHPGRGPPGDSPPRDGGVRPMNSVQQEIMTLLRHLWATSDGPVTFRDLCKPGTCSRKRAVLFFVTLAGMHDAGTVITQQADATAPMYVIDPQSSPLRLDSSSTDDSDVE